MEKCRICKRPKSKNDLRLGACWECAEAESIIGNGTDMYDKGPNGEEIIAAASPMAKLSFLIAKGWRYGK